MLLSANSTLQNHRSVHIVEPRSGNVNRSEMTTWVTSALASLVGAASLETVRIRSLNSFNRILVVCGHTVGWVSSVRSTCST
jgi:hypothetical protein